ncbi:hypothetical protein ACGFS9_09425 [Streptomyces sp. NPDC048566]|uniref:hypothetical protein n=1 Tax=Streptomyces sp. NPDC048566 TaxID=3365569 RepID=UPI00371296B5
MDTLTVLASAAFGSTLCLTTLSTLRWLDRATSPTRIIGLVVTALVLCATVAVIADASRGVVVGFIAGGLITPPVHRWIVHRRGNTARP